MKPEPRRLECLLLPLLLLTACATTTVLVDAPGEFYITAGDLFFAAIDDVFWLLGALGLIPF